MKIFDVLGFHWDRNLIPDTVPVHSRERVCFRFHRMMPEFVWDASVLEGNPLTFPEVKTLIDGITVGGRKLSDQTQVLNLIESSKRLWTMVKSDEFTLDKETFTLLHSEIARTEALEWGVFRGEGQEHHYTPGVGLGDGNVYMPVETKKNAPELNMIFDEGITVLADCPPFERSMAFFLFGALQQFFFDGNKRTSRMMMNGILMSNGIDAISIPALKAQEYNEKMVRFYKSKDANEMMDFLIDCHPDAQVIRDILTTGTLTNEKNNRELGLTFTKM